LCSSNKKPSDEELNAKRNGKKKKRKTTVQTKGRRNAPGGGDHSKMQGKPKGPRNKNQEQGQKKKPTEEKM